MRKLLITACVVMACALLPPHVLAQSAATQPDTVAPDTPTAPAASSPFRRKDVPPQGIAGLLSFFSAGGGGGCPIGKPPDTAEECQVQIPFDLTLTFPDFRPNLAYDVV